MRGSAEAIVDRPPRGAMTGFALVLCAVLAACAAPPPVAPSRSPAPVVRSAPDAVILRPEDVPPSYLVESDEAMSQEALAQGLGVNATVIKERLATGYARSYKDPAEPFVCCVIDSILIANADGAAARATLANFLSRAKTLGSVETELGATLGDESRALVFEHRDATGDLVTVSLVFRYTNVVNAVEMTGRPGSFERTRVLEYARKQLDRLRADAEGRP